MSQQRIIGALLALALVIGLIIFFWPKPQMEPIAAPLTPPQVSVPLPVTPVEPQRPPPVDPEAAKRGEPLRNEPNSVAIAKYLAAVRKSIVFHGKVVDEKTNSIIGAKVSYTSNNNPNPMGTGSQGETVTDANGLFSIETSGYGIYVEVSKDGYYRTSEAGGKRGSYGNFSNADQPARSDVGIPPAENPAIFVLRKMGQAVPLVQIEQFIRVPRNGTAVEISLETGKTVPTGHGDLRVEAWTQDQNPDVAGHYDWRCRISVPGGGLIERKDQFAFEAPVDGYMPADEINMPKAAERWNPQASREYFVKLSDNLYARLRFEMIAGGDHFFSIKSYLNPSAGSRNLEFDPAKAVQTSK